MCQILVEGLLETYLEFSAQVKEAARARAKTPPAGRKPGDDQDDVPF
jgi:hypothetical protein